MGGGRRRSSAGLRTGLILLYRRMGIGIGLLSSLVTSEVTAILVGRKLEVRRIINVG